MSFRRMPFQFSTTDPVERQRELEKRFGLPSSRNMFVDVANPLSAGTLPKDSSISSGSPRLQHRVPIFVEGYDQPIHSSVDSTGIAPENKKPNVRIIPIEVEGAERRPSTTRHRTLSGPAGIAKEGNDSLSQVNETSPLKRSMVDLSQPSMTKSTTLPRVHNIPIQVEGARNTKSPKLEKVAKSPKVNGCTVTKSKVKSPDKDLKRKPEPSKVLTEAEKQEIALENSLKKIENVLEELKSYETGVQEFIGTTKDKQYRYLDEMLTRCMLKMDEIDTMGNENLRSARKNAVKKIQACIDLLESKANTVSEAENTSSSQNEVKVSEGQETKVTCENDVDMSEDQTVEQKTNRILVENGDEGALQKVDVEMTGDQNVEPDTIENVVENGDASRNEVDMAEQPFGQKPNKTLVENDQNALQKTDVKPDVRGNVVENCEAENESQKKDVEMAESQNVPSESPKNKQVSPEVVSSQKDVTDVCEIPVKENSSVELLNEVTEVEMAEIKKTLSSQDLSSEVPEVEMTDNANIQDSNLDTVPVKEEKVAEVSNLELVSDVSQNDVEMKDVQSTLNDLKETVAEDKYTKCISSSQPEEKTESNVNIETACNNDVKIPQNAQCDNDIQNVS